jgi:hypothetical protein
MTLNEIQSNIAAKRQMVDYSVNIFRGKTHEEGWVMKKTRPRDSDEIKALNYIARKSFRAALQDGTVLYDNERRVMILAKYSRS